MANPSTAVKENDAFGWPCAPIESLRLQGWNSHGIQAATREQQR